MEKESALMQQYTAIKEKYPDAVLLFSVGDFYEAFKEDAVIVSEVLGLTLTSTEKYQLAGFPHHALDPYLHKLVKAGHRVALCEQEEEKSFKPVKRKV